MSAAPGSGVERRVRITLRCLTEDLGMPIPVDTADLGQLDHPMLAEARRVAPTAPQGQRRILAIPAPPLVLRLRRAQWRGAAWVEVGAHPAEVFWLLATALRREGDRADAFEHFVNLHAANRLLPTADDYLRLRVESAARLFDQCAADLQVLLAAADAAPGADHAALLGGCVPARMFKELDEGYQTYWFAQAVLMPNRRPVPDSLRDIIFAKALEFVQPEEADAVYAWPTGGALSGHEIARLYLRRS